MLLIERIQSGPREKPLGRAGFADFMRRKKRGAFQGVIRIRAAQVAVQKGRKEGVARANRIHDRARGDCRKPPDEVVARHGKQRALFAEADHEHAGMILFEQPRRPCRRVGRQVFVAHEQNIGRRKKIAVIWIV